MPNHQDPTLHCPEPMQRNVALCGLTVEPWRLAGELLAFPDDEGGYHFEVAKGHIVGPSCVECVARRVGQFARLCAAAPPLTVENLSVRRIAAGLTRDALASMAGVSPATIRNIEKRRHRATAAVWRRLNRVARFLR